MEQHYGVKTLRTHKTEVSKYCQPKLFFASVLPVLKRKVEGQRFNKRTETEVQQNN